MHYVRLRIKTSDAETDYTVGKFPLVIGASEDADIQISDTFVAHEHCKIIHEDGRLILCDLDDQHGTYLNRRAVKRASLSAGDQFGIGFATVLIADIGEALG